MDRKIKVRTKPVDILDQINMAAIKSEVAAKTKEMADRITLLEERIATLQQTASKQETTLQSIAEVASIVAASNSSTASRLNELLEGLIGSLSVYVSAIVQHRTGSSVVDDLTNASNLLPNLMTLRQILERRNESSGHFDNFDPDNWDEGDDIISNVSENNT